MLLIVSTFSSFLPPRATQYNAFQDPFMLPEEPNISRFMFIFLQTFRVLPVQAFDKTPVTQSPQGSQGLESASKVM